MRALNDILEHEVLGQTARYERFMADLMFFVASGKHIDPEKSPRFAEQVEKVYSNSFKKPQKPRTAAEVKEYILSRIRELRGVKNDGSAEAERKD